MIPYAIASQAVIQNVSRRGFLKGTLATGGLVVALQLMPARRAFAYATGGDDMPHGLVADPHVFVSIDESGIVTIMAHRSEMGTGSKTSLPMVVADELDADWSRVRIEQAPGDEPKYGNQDTDGSRSMRHHIQSMRQIGASVRSMLEQAAAKEWGVDAAEVEAQSHEVVHTASGRKLGYGELAKAAMDLPVPPAEQLKLKEPSAFRYMGKSEISIYDLHDITTGKAVYGYDVMLQGMKFAVVARPPVVGGKVKSFDDSKALQVPGVERVIELPAWAPGSKFAPLGGVAVVASNTGAAIKGREALTIEWDDGPNAGYDTAAYRKRMEETARMPGKVVRDQGDAEAALASAAKVFTTEYYLPHLAHAAMEPPAAVARVAGGKCEVWAPVQSPYGTREDVANMLGLGIDNVTVNVTLLGGGFGRKSKCDFALEAALLARETGAPVKVAWTREDDIRHCFYHTTSVEHIEAGMDADGKVVAWRHRSVAPTIMSTFAADQTHQTEFELAMGFVDMPFDIPNVRCENGEATAHTRIGWFRSVSNVPRAFAIQSFVTELAHELGKDPKDFLLELIGSPRKFDPVQAGIKGDFWNYGEPLETFPIDTGRLRGVIELAAAEAGWGKQLPPRQGLGIAAHRSFVTYVATVVHAIVDEDGNVTVPEVHTAIDCGFPVNPERIRSQIEGAAVMGMTLAKYGEITHKNGHVEQGNFDTYEMLRIEESPTITHVHIVPHDIDTPAAGVGEPGLPPFAPALYNAVFAATGKRIRSMPLKNHDLRAI